MTPPAGSARQSGAMLLAAAIAAFVAGPSHRLAARGQAPATAPEAAAQQPEAPTFRAGVDLLVVEASVAGRDGAAPPGLGPDDFVVEIDGRPRRVVSAELITFDETATPVRVEDEGVTTNASMDEGRSILIVVDQETLPVSARGLTEAARRWVASLSPADRVGLVSLPPPGPRVEFTTRHERVLEALGRVVFAAQDGANPVLSGPAVSLWEAMRIGEGDERTLSEVLSRECPMAASVDVLCAQEAQNNAYEIAADARAKTGPVITNLRALIESLGALPGRKDLVLLSGGWVLPEQALVPQMQGIAAAAAAARVTMHGILSDTSSLSVSTARMRAGAPFASRDKYLLSQSLDTMAGMTGGLSLQLAGSGILAFERIEDAISSYYRLGVEPEPRDLDGRSHRLSVKVRRSGLSVRDHRRVVTAVTPVVDPSLTAEEALDRVLRTPMALTDLGLRVTSQVVSSDDADAASRVVLGVEVLRAVPGYTTAQVLISDQDGQIVASTGRELDIDASGIGGFFTMVGLPDGRYDVRVAARDGEGRMGTIVHPLEALPVAHGRVRAHGLTVFEYDDRDPSPLRPIFGEISRDALMVARVDLVDVPAGMSSLPVTFEFVSASGNEVLVREETTAEPSRTGGALVAESALPAAELPPGVYLIRATLGAGAGDEAGAPLPLTRYVKLADRPRRELARAEVERAGPAASVVPTTRVVGSASAESLPVPAFSLASMLTPTFVGGAKTQAESYADAAVSARLVRELETGIAKLRDRQPDEAASALRNALRTAPDFRPALALLGACYAVGGAHAQAAAAWQTAVLADRGNPDVHRVAIDGWLRAERPGAAVALAREAVERWPADPGFRRQFAAALFADGRPAEAVDQVLAVATTTPDDEPLLAAAMTRLYRASQDGTPLLDASRDREAMRTLAARYPASGPRAALVSLWLREVER